MASMRESRDSDRFIVNTQVQSHALLRRGFGTSVPFIVMVTTLVLGICPRNRMVIDHKFLVTTHHLFTLYIANLLCVHVSSAGLLDAVSNLRSESLGQIIHLTWDAPPSLDITGVDLDIWYRVDISVDNISVRTYDDINIPEFSFTMDYDTSTSVVYEFQVTPINGAGAGMTSDPVTGYFTGRELLMCMLYNYAHVC